MRDNSRQVLLKSSNSRMITSTEERGGVSSAHYHVKRYAPKRVTVNRAVFDKVKRCCFTRPLRPFQEDFKESYHRVKWASDVPFEEQPPYNQTYFTIMLRINTDLQS